MRTAFQSLLAGLLLLAGPALNAQNESINVSPVTPIPAASGQEAQSNPAGPKVVELPSYDSRENFSYHINKDNDNVVVIVPSDGTAPLYVSKGFLGMVMSDPGVSDARRLEQLKAYETLTLQARTQFMNETFPGADKQTKAYQTSALRAGENDVILEQDPKAGPYVRITITDKAGEIVKQFSVAKNIADEIMNHPYMTIEQKLEVLGQTANHLPEEVRDAFSSLSREEFEALIEKKPDVARQEFTKMAPLFAEARKQEAERRSKRLTALKNTPNQFAVGTSTDNGGSGASRLALNGSKAGLSAQATLETRQTTGKTTTGTRSWDSSLVRLAIIFLLVGLSITALGFLTRGGRGIAAAKN